MTLENIMSDEGSQAKKGDTMCSHLESRNIPVTTIREKEVMDLKEQVVYMGGFGGRKGKGEMI